MSGKRIVDYGSIFKEYTAHIAACEAKTPVFKLGIPIVVAATLIANIQLALRHPGNGGASSKMMEFLKNNMIEQLDKASPGFGKILRMGDDPSCDPTLN